MAVVYKAHQPNLNRHVALKILHPHFMLDTGFGARFQKEAETVARLSHPNILPIFDYGQHEGMPFIVMPLVLGGTLRNWLDKGVSLGKSLEVFGRVLHALEYAHNEGVIHRDVKPSNIMMSHSDWPLLADFGLVKLSETPLDLASSNSVVGTPEYMAPEQSQGLPVDRRADIYSMGVMLYQLLTGRLPYQGPSAMAVMLAHIREPVPSPSALNLSLDRAWDDVVHRGLAKDPADRYASAQEMNDAVAVAWRDNLHAPDAHPRPRQADVSQLYDSAVRALQDGDWQLVVSLCTAIVASDPSHSRALYLLQQAQEELGRRHHATSADERIQHAGHLIHLAELALAEERFLEAQNGYRQAVALLEALPDPMLTAEARSLLAHGRSRLVLVERPTPVIAPSPPPGGGAVATGVRVYVANRNDGSISVVDGGSRTVMATVVVGAGPLGLAVAPDGSRVFVADRAGNRLQVLDTRRQQVVASVSTGSGPYGVAVHPLISQVYVTNRFSGSVAVVDASRNAVTASVPVGRSPAGAAVSPDGRRVYVANFENDSVSVIDTDSHLEVATVRVGSGPESVAITPDGTRVYVANFRSDSLSVVDAVHNRLVGTIPVGAGPYGLAISPDGARLYVTDFDADAVSVIATASQAVIASVPVRHWPRGITAAPDGSGVYVANRGGDCVQVIDPATNAVVATIPVGASPYGIAAAG
jgi:serine/threonine-protein kinase